MITMLARRVWSAVVMGAGWGLANGLWLSTYFERTEQARIDDARGEVWMWVATVVLAVAALIARGAGERQPGAGHCSWPPA